MSDAIVRSEATLSRPDADLTYDDTGRGPVLLYAHGVFMSRAEDERLGVMDWSPVIARGNRLVRYDARGHGRSTGRPVALDYSFAHLADDLLAMADHVQPHAPIRAAGASMGAATLLHAVVRNPDRFERLILIIPPTAWAARRAQASAYSAQADVVAQAGKDALVAAMRNIPAPPALADCPGWPLLPDVTEALLPSVMRGIGSSDLPDTDALARLQHPALLLTWSEDPVHPTATAEQLHGLLPNSRLHIATTPQDLTDWPTHIAEFLA
ncbi:alpha/beta fold hydrolase [Nocardia sp. NEAU-G5]|uniref:Alpha/beta fold hydrolase n=1 Tax=Nocardia albiluteola TaxID=2842303 RepID=A0ABS6B6V0_9NOCA|nr:alpha/beta fold hydrolase [Nocardia albiluteola]MBU3066017.1 alpha/beta fold hydrolase [Nocardia albiluteola]